MAVPTVAITGSLVDPGGVGVTSGTIVVSLSEPARASGAVVGGHVRWTLGPGGALPPTAALVPNDAITPAGTSYRVRVEALLADGTHATWSEVWKLNSTPNPIAVGAISHSQSRRIQTPNSRSRTLIRRYA